MSCPLPVDVPATPPKLHSLTREWKRKLQNRRNRRQSASARHSVANMITEKMQKNMTSPHATDACSIATMVPGVNECCGDTGASDDMYPDYECFVSYTPLVDKWALLGDDHLV